MYPDQCAKLDKLIEVKHQLVEISTVREDFRGEKNQCVKILLDICRNNSKQEDTEESFVQSLDVKSQ